MTDHVSLWSRVQLGEILTYIDPIVELDDEVEYTTITVKRRHGGLEAREKSFGSQIRTKKQYKLVPGAFIISRVQCWHQAYAIVPNIVEPNMIASTNYDQFVISPEVNERYFWWLSHSPVFTEIVRSCSFGVVIEKMVFNRNAWLDKTISLPPLSEQRRIAARIEELTAKIEEARGLRQGTVEEVEKVLKEAEFRIWADESLEKASCLDEITTFLSRGRQSEQGESKHYLIKTQHVQQGNYVRSHITLAPEIAAKVQPDAVVHPGDVLIACSAAGCLGRVARFMETDQVASVDTHVAIARANPQFVLPEYLYSYLKGAQGQIQLRSRERGDWMREKVGFRLTELNLADLKRVPIPLPSLDEQRRIVTYLNDLQSKVDNLKRIQAETSAELNALLPSILDRAFKGEL